MNHITIGSLYEKAKALTDALEILADAETELASTVLTINVAVMSRLPNDVADMDMPLQLKTWLSDIGIYHKWALVGLSVDHLMRNECWSLPKVHTLYDWMKSNGLKLKERDND